MKRKKVLIVNQHFSTGGIKKSLDNLLPILMEKYDIKVMFLCGSTEEFKRKYQNIFIPSPFILSSIISSLEDLRGMNLFFIRVIIKVFCFLLGKIVDQEKILNTAIGLSRKLKGYNCAIAYSHDNWFNDGTYFGGANRLVTKKVEAAKKIAWIHGEPHEIRLTEERLFKTYMKFDQVVTVSQACKKEFEELSKGKINCKCIYNLMGADGIREKSENVKYKEDNQLFKIVTVTRLSRIAKRVDKINEIAKLLYESGYNFSWTVVGGGAEYESCVNVSKKYGIDPFVHYVGDQDNPYIYMKEADILILVSDSEAMSIVLKEALIVGTPVITTDFPAAYETVINEKNGFVVRRDVYDIYEKIAFCIEHREILRDCREYIKKNPINEKESIDQIVEIIG